VGVYIHNLKNLNGAQARKGGNPLDYVTLTRSGTPLSAVAKAYDPPYTDSKQVYAYVADHLSSWIDEAIRIRRHA
jgi:hypothetical protein